MRGWTGKTTGISAATRSSAAIASPSSGPSTSAGRCRVTSRNEPGSTPAARAAPRSRNRCSSATRVSIIVLPTNRNPRSSTPSARRLSSRLGRVQEEQLGEVIGDDPVDLLRHRAVEAPQPGLDVADRDPEPGRAERRGEGRVDVAGNQDEVRSLVAKHRLQPLEHARGLLAVAARADPEHVVRLRYPELLEEDLRHRPVVVLAGVDDHRRVGAEALPGRRDDRRHLDQVRPRADDVSDPHRLRPSVRGTRSGRRPRARTAPRRRCRSGRPGTRSAPRGAPARRPSEPARAG